MNNNNNEFLVENYEDIDEYNSEYVDEYNLYFDDHEKYNNTCPEKIKSGNHCLTFA